MGWRFRHSVQLVPGIRINFTKSGISTTVGVKGAHTTFGKGRVTHTVGIPGTGVSYRSTSRSSQRPISWKSIVHVVGWLLALAAIGVLFSGAVRPGFVLSGVALVIVAGLVWHFSRRPSKSAPVPPAAPSLDQVHVRDYPIGVESRRGVVAPSASEIRQLQDEHKQRLQRIEARRRLVEAQRAEAVARELEEAKVARIFDDRLRTLLFIARDDGMVRGKERDIIVSYFKKKLESPAFDDATLKARHSKMGRDTRESVLEIVARLGSAGGIDQALINTTEALITQTKKISPAQLGVLSVLKNERARGPWRPASPHANGSASSTDIRESDED